jgi:hypothetical protein
MVHWLAAGLSARSIRSPIQTVCIRRIMLLEKTFRSIPEYSLLSMKGSLRPAPKHPRLRLMIDGTGSAAPCGVLSIAVVSIENPRARGMRGETASRAITYDGWRDGMIVIC